MMAMHTIQQAVEGPDVVLYDSECRFCTSGVDTLRRLDGRGRLQFVSLHSPSVPKDYPDLTHEMLMAEMWVVTSRGDRYAGADAFRYLTRRLPILYPLAPLMHLPFTMPLWRWCYRFVARNRYRLAGRNCTDGACRIHGR